MLAAVRSAVALPGALSVRRATTRGARVRGARGAAARLAAGRDLVAVRRDVDAEREVRVASERLVMYITLHYITRSETSMQSAKYV